LSATGLPEKGLSIKGEREWGGKVKGSEKGGVTGVDFQGRVENGGRATVRLLGEEKRRRKKRET